MEQCQILREYAIYVARVRKYAKYMQLETAVKKAVDECIQEEILEEFLRKNRAEVIAVSIFEYDEKREKELIRKAEFAEGERVGLEKGERVGLEKGEKIGMKEGMDRIFEINRLFRKKYTEKQIAEKMGLDEQEVRKILERLNALG